MSSRDSYDSHDDSTHSLLHPIHDAICGSRLTHIQNSHFFWNLATVRSIVPNTIPTADLFTPLADALARYPADTYELVIGSATHADFDAKTVSVSVSDSDGAVPRDLAYDQLVLATGSRCVTTDVPWKLVDDYARTVALLDATRDKVRTAENVVVAGAGATGVELAAELGFEYGGGPGSVKGGSKKEVLLLCSGDAVLGGDSVAGAAVNELKKLGVTVRTGAKVEDVRTLDDGKTEVRLRGGEVLLTDLYLPTMGMVPNSEYVDEQYLSEHKTVDVDEFFRVRAPGGCVWAAGDIVSRPRSGFMITQKQVSPGPREPAFVRAGAHPPVLTPT